MERLKKGVERLKKGVERLKKAVDTPPPPGPSSRVLKDCVQDTCTFYDVTIQLESALPSAMSEEAAAFLNRAKTRKHGVSQLTRLGRLPSAISLPESVESESYVQGRDNHDADDQGREGYKERVRRFLGKQYFKFILYIDRCFVLS